jgi:hypothetical protein
VQQEPEPEARYQAGNADSPFSAIPTITTIVFSKAGLLNQRSFHYMKPVLLRRRYTVKEE